MRQGEEFTLDETKARKGVATPRTIGRFERFVAARKGFVRYFNMIGDDSPNASERVELEALRDQINTVLSHQHLCLLATRKPKRVHVHGIGFITNKLCCWSRVTNSRGY